MMDESNNRGNDSRISMRANAQETDGDIFKLGSAFKTGNVNLDDFLNQFTNAPGCKVEKDKDGKTTITRVIKSGDGGDGNNGATQTIITKPVVRTKRKITIIRNGEPVEADDDMLRELNLAHLIQDDSPQDEEVPVEEANVAKEDEKESDENWSDCDPGRPIHLDIDDHELFTSSEDEETEKEWLMSCFKKRATRKEKLKRKQTTMPEKGGRVGMAASEVSSPGQDSQLPAIQLLVMNYNRMLDDNPEQFKETLFRAVKLNGLEVVTILTKLVTRKNIPLGSYMMRESESSATVLHVALLYNHFDIIRYLIELGDKNLITGSYTTEEYKNQTTLHVAVANGNLDATNLLLRSLQKKERKKLMNAVASGSYFQKQHPAGQLCLTAAAWARNGDMLKLLASYGANFKNKNLEGNTVLHSIVLSLQDSWDVQIHEDMIDSVFEAIGVWSKHLKYKSTIEDHIELEQKEKQVSMFHQMLKIRNNDGNTPLSLAAQTGSPLLLHFINMEKIYKIPQTRLGSIAWVTFDVTEITSFSDEGYNKYSVLHVLAHNSGKLSRSANREVQQEILDSEPVKSIIEMKWSVYRWIYIAWCLLHAAHMSLFTYCTFYSGSSPVVVRHNGTLESLQPDIIDVPLPRLFYLPFFLILPFIYIVLEGIDLFGIIPYSVCMMQHQSFLSRIAGRIKSEWVITGNGPYRCVCLAFSISSFVWFILYRLRSNGQMIALSMALLFGWIFNLFFTRGCRVTSRFSIMIQKMFFRDLMYFIAVYMMILGAFSFSVNALYIKTPAIVPDSSYMDILYNMMNTVTQMESKQEDIINPMFPSFTKALLLFYSIVAVILLMNMLIAMMNTSYETVRITGRSIWKQQQLSIMLMIERRLFWVRKLCKLSQKGFWHKELDYGNRVFFDVTTTQSNDTIKNK